MSSKIDGVPRELLDRLQSRATTLEDWDALQTLLVTPVVEWQPVYQANYVGEVGAWRDVEPDQYKRFATLEHYQVRTLYTAPVVDECCHEFVPFQSACTKCGEPYIAAPVVERQPSYKSYITQPAESLAGMAARQLKDEKRWIEIRDANALEFPGMGPHDYYPVGSAIRIPDAPPELAELQATIARLTAENERLKAGQGEPVALPERSFVGDIRNPYRHTVLHDGYISGWNAYQDAMVKLGPLYTSQPAPVSVVLDETQAFANWTHQVIVEMENNGTVHRVRRRDRMSLSEEKAAFDAWNARACLDKVKELNQ